MANYDQNRIQTGATTQDLSIDQGLRAYMLRVYNYMAAGLAITGLVAWFSFTAAVQQTAAGLELTSFGNMLYNSPLKWVVMFAPLGMVMLLSFGVQRMSFGAAQIAFWSFAALMGLSLSSIFLLYTGESITQTFFVTAIAFGGLSLYGYTTKRNLGPIGSFLIMGLIGIIVASLVNLWLQSSALQFAVSAIGVVVFAGLTAYDTQRIKEMYFEGDDMSTMGKKAIMGALNLYLDFINLFLMLLRFMGNQRS